MTDIQERRKLRLAEWVAGSGGHSEVVKRFRLTTSKASYLSQCVNGYPIGEKAARNWEQLFKLSSGYLDRSDTGGGLSPSGQLAHPMSQVIVQTVPLVQWGEVMSEDRKGTLPDKFLVAAPDESMAPRVRAGAMLLMSTLDEPRPGDGVLVVDQLGGLHFRRYKASRPGVWEAHAESDAYAPLESERDGLRVLAVLLGVQERWG